MLAAYSKLQPKFDLAAKYFLMLTGFFIPISITGFSIALVITAFFALLAGQWLHKIKMLLANPIFIVAIVFFILLLISLIYSSAPWADNNQVIGKYSKLFYLIIFMPLFVEERWQRRGIDAFLLAMVVTLTTSFFKWFGWIKIGGDSGLGTLFTNHINTGFLMAFAAFVLAHRAWHKRQLHWGYLLLFVLFVFHLFFMNEGRTGYAVFLVLTALFLWQQWQWRGLLIACLILPLLLASAYVVSPKFKDRIAMINQDLIHYQEKQLSGNSVGLRMSFTKHSLELVELHPWIGTGIGSFKTQYSQHFPPDPGFANMGNPQNEYLMIAVQLGLVGLAVFLMLFVLQWFAAAALPEDLAFSAQGMIIGFLTGCFSDTFLYLAITGYFFVYFTALFFARTSWREIIRQN